MVHLHLLLCLQLFTFTIAKDEYLQLTHAFTTLFCHARPLLLYFVNYPSNSRALNLVPLHYNLGTSQLYIPFSTYHSFFNHGVNGQKKHLNYNIFCILDFNYVLFHWHIYFWYNTQYTLLIVPLDILNLMLPIHSTANELSSQCPSSICKLQTNLCVDSYIVTSPCQGFCHYNNNPPPNICLVQYVSRGNRIHDLDSDINS